MAKRIALTVVAWLVTLHVSAGLLRAETDEEELVTWFTMDEGNGKVIADSAPYGESDDTSELRGGVTWTKAGVHGGALRFSGKNGSYVFLKAGTKDIQANRSKEPHRRSTFAFWFQCEDNQKARSVQTLFETGGFHNNLNIFIYEGQLYVGVNSGYPHSIMGPQWLNSLDNLIDGATFELVDDRWCHLAFVIEADGEPVDDGYRVYLDGQLIMTGRGVQLEGHGAQGGLGAVNDEAIYPRKRGKGGKPTDWRTIPTEPKAPDAAHVKHGKLREEECRGIHPFAGCLDDFRLYRRVLSAEELNSLHNEGRQALEAAKASTSDLQNAIEEDIE